MKFLKLLPAGAQYCTCKANVNILDDKNPPQEFFFNINIIKVSFETSGQRNFSAGQNEIFKISPGPEHNTACAKRK